MEGYYMPVTEHLDAYEQDLAARDLRPATRRDYRHKLRQFARWVDEQEGPLVTIGLLRDYRDYLQQDRALRPRTICACFCALRDYRRWLTNSGRHDHPMPDPGDVRLSPKDKARRLLPTNEEVNLFFAAARAMPANTVAARYERAKALAFLAFGVYCGLRAFETLALRTDDIRQDGEKHLVYVRCGKGGKSRRVPLHDDALPHTRELMEARDAWLRVHEAGPGRLRERLFLKSKSAAHQHVGLGNALARLRSSAGITRNITYHCFRHWCATALLRAGVDPRTVQEILGHSSLETTLSYLHTDYDAMESGIGLLRPEKAALLPGADEIKAPLLPDEATRSAPRYQRRPGTRKGTRNNG